MEYNTKILPCDEIVMLKDINEHLMENDVDIKIINETNNQLRQIEQDLKDLSDIFNTVNNLIGKENDNINKIEENVVSIDETIDYIVDDTINDLTTIEHQYKNYTTAKIAGGAIIGGTIAAGVGAFFGIVPCIIGAGIGLSIGTGCSLLINKKIFDF